MNHPIIESVTWAFEYRRKRFAIENSKTTSAEHRKSRGKGRTRRIV